MNAKRLALISLFVGLQILSASSKADDIDIYAALGTANNTPNVLFILDNSANFSASSGGVTCKQQADGSLAINAVSGTLTAMGTTVGGIEQCALYNVLKYLPVNADGSARINVGFMMYNGTTMRDVNNANCGGSLGGCLAQPLIPMTTANKPALLNWIASWNTSGGVTPGNVKAAGSATAATMQEAWAYFKGTVGLSTRDYSSIQPAGGCQQNFIIYVGNSYSASSGPGDANSGGPLAALNTAIANQPQPSSLTAAQWSALQTTWATPILNSMTTACGAYNFATPSSNHMESQGDYADEWARFMHEADLYSTTPAGIQAISTYTVGFLNPASCKPEYPALMKNMADKGGGDYYATTSYDSIVNAILKILNEVQAVNSVFSSSSLPVSVNAQGTFLNQVYMGMFRPDPGAAPRWVGNLKQYQFVYDTNTSTLRLSDSLGHRAIDPTTGFVTPNAISFWTCTNLTTPYANSYLSTYLLASDITLLGKNGQNCSDPTGGFWVNDHSSANAAAQGYDLADGELVDRGGAAQQIRLVNLTDDYVASPAAPRHLYTWCGSSCSTNLTNDANAFATSNTSLMANSSAFGSVLTANISGISRTVNVALDNIVTVTTTGNHGFSTGDPITIANASPSDYDGTFTITKVDNTHFTYPITVYPPITASGTYAATKSGSPISITGMSYANNTVTVTAPAHGFTNNSTVVISCTPVSTCSTAYTGSYVISYIDANTFSYSLIEQPPTVAGSPSGTTSATVSIVSSASGKSSTTFAINAFNASTPGVARALGSSTVTVTTVPNTVVKGGTTSTQTIASVYQSGYNTITIAGVVDSTGAPVSAYNGSFRLTNISGNTVTFSVTPVPSGTISGTFAAAAPSTTASIASLTRVGNTATATTSAAHGFSNGDTISIGVPLGGTAGSNEGAYQGTFIVGNVTSTTFDYTVATTPITPANGVSGATMTATRTSGLDASNLAALVNWVRGQDNQGDEFGPGGSVTIRPSVHGDVLHSRPTVVNYGSYSLDITGTTDSGTVRTATTSDTTALAASAATPVVTFANGNACPVTVASATTFTYQNTLCGAAGAQTVSFGSKVVVFYGDNGGVFHAVNGNQTALFGATPPGNEMWGFIPAETFLKLNRQKTNSPQLNLPSTPPGITPVPLSKDYFVDGTTGIYQTIDASGNTTRAVLYLSMRRGGSYIYAIDVTAPATPTVLWKVDATGLTNASGFTATTDYSELGETWSQPKVAKVKGYCGGSACSSSNLPTPVLIFGGGYDTDEDANPPASADISGRAIYVLDALTGRLVWKASHSSGSTTSCSGTTTLAGCAVAGMNYAIPADMTLVDRDFDGFIDRIYAADNGGNIWRVDLQPGGNATPDNWRVYQFAALGCGSGACANPSTSVPQRKFFYPPEVITATTRYNYDSVIAGSGDREHPLYSSTRRDDVYLLKDTYTGDSAAGMTTPITMNGTLSLFNATSTPWDGTLNGYYITFASGEKVVNAPLVTAGYVYFSTNQPAPPNANSCSSNLGIATGYTLNPFAGTLTHVVFNGGGLPPSPVSGVVDVIVGGVVKQVPFLMGAGNPNCVGADCASALGAQKPPINVSTKRSRNYWYIENK